MSDSEIAELCRRIYNHHRQALDLIFEHRPDLQWDLAEVLKGLIQETKSRDLVLDHASKSYVRFSVSEWDSFPAQRAGQGWTKSRRILVFEFQNAPDLVTLRLIIGPGPDEVRQAIYQVTSSHPRVFRGGSKRLYPKFTTTYVRRFIARQDYKDADLDTLLNKVQGHWEKFISQDLPAMRGAVAKVEWPELSAIQGP